MKPPTRMVGKKNTSKKLQNHNTTYIAKKKVKELSSNPSVLGASCKFWSTSGFDQASVFQVFFSLPQKTNPATAGKNFRVVSHFIIFAAVTLAGWHFTLLKILLSTSQPLA